MGPTAQVPRGYTTQASSTVFLTLFSAGLCSLCEFKKKSVGIGPQLAKEADTDTAFIVHGLLRLAGSHRKQKLYASWFVKIWGYPAQPIYSCSIALMNWLVCSSNTTALGLIVENVFLVTIPLGSPAQPVLGLILYL